jgi:hypothetical protein
VTGRPTSPGDLTSAEQPIVFVIDDDESMRRGLTHGPEGGQAGARRTTGKNTLARCSVGRSGKGL